MKSSVPCLKEYTVYPGEYCLLPEMEILLKELKIAHSNISAKPCINLTESNDCFIMEIALPGIKREDIFMSINDNVLSVIVAHQNTGNRNQKQEMHEFDIENLERHILLPDNADAEFVIAEYKQGILVIHIPKAEINKKGCNGTIVVY
ncbi:MAG: Hsp20/alpha crystallin family protein [Chitinophagaceae bacterium]|nr:Hsp20/alpha crystallin family protein [Chitinophagaceae bacterium]